MRDLYHWEQARFRKPWKYVKVEQEAGLLIRSSSEDNDDGNKNGKKRKEKKLALGLDWKNNFFVHFLVIVVRPRRDTGLFQWFCGGPELKTSTQHLINWTTWNILTGEF